MMQGTLFSVCHYLGIRTPFSSQRIAEEPAACSHEGAIGPCLAMKQQHVLTYFQHSKCVCVCLQPNWEQISEELLNGTYKLIAKWLKSLGCYLSVSLWEALCHNSERAVSLLPTNHLSSCDNSEFYLSQRKKKNERYIGSITCHYLEVYFALVCEKERLIM